MTLLSISTLDSEPLPTDFVSLHEYRSSAPASFSLEESPVLYYSADKLVLKSKLLHRVFRNPPLTSLEFASFYDKCETGILANVKVVSSRLFLWFPQKSFGYSIPYTSITLHGIASATTMFLQISVPDGLLPEDPFVSAPLTPESDKDNSPMFFEIFIDVKDQSQVQQFYKAMNDCSSLHTDADSSGDDFENNEVENEREASFRNLMATAISGGAGLGKPGNGYSGSQGPLDMSRMNTDFLNMEIEIPLAEQLANDPKSMYEEPADSVMFANHGDADDLDIDMDIDIDCYGDDNEEEEGLLEGHWLTDAAFDYSNAGMHIELPQDDGIKAGTRRQREEKEEEEGDYYEEDHYGNRIDQRHKEPFDKTPSNREVSGKWRRVG